MNELLSTASAARNQHWLPRSAAEAMEAIVRQPTLVVPALFRGDTQVTQRWMHDVFCGPVPPISANVLRTIYCGSSGASARAEFAGSWFDVRAGTLIVIPQNTGTYWQVDRPIEVSHVYLTRQRLQHCADVVAKGRAVELLPRFGCEDAIAFGVLKLLSQEARDYDPSSSLFIEQCIDLLCTHLVRQHSSLGELPPQSRPRGLAAWQIKRVERYMKDCLDEEIGLDELAAQIHMSRFHFCTAFRLATGQSPHQWLTRQRLQRACELLAQSPDSITQIALAVGYKTPSAFTASFRKVIGVTPSEFRRQL